MLEPRDDVARPLGPDRTPAIENPPARVLRGKCLEFARRRRLTRNRVDLPAVVEGEMVGLRLAPGRHASPGQSENQRLRRPSAFMREASVVPGSPRISAAPPLP